MQQQLGRLEERFEQLLSNTSPKSSKLPKLKKKGSTSSSVSVASSSKSDDEEPDEDVESEELGE